MLNRTGGSPGNDTKSPYEVCTMKSPDISFLQIFGTDAYDHVPAANRRKLDYKSKKGVFVGYSTSSKAYSLDSDWSQNGDFKGCNFQQ